MTVLADANLRLALVIGIGYLARRRVSTSVDFVLSGRALPASGDALAFISANLGAIEVMGRSPNGPEYGKPTAHYFWVGAIPAMLFLGFVMMPFHDGSKLRSVPEFMPRRFGKATHLVNGISFATAQVLIAGANRGLGDRRRRDLQRGLRFMVIVSAGMRTPIIGSLLTAVVVFVLTESGVWALLAGIALAITIVLNIIF